MKSMFTNDTAAIFDAKARAVRAYHLMQWARWATFCLYIVAVFMLYVSDVWGIASFLENNSNEYVALAIFSVTSFILAYFLASSKEAVYEDIALNRSEGFHMTAGQRFAMVLFASAGILFELFSATSNQQHISNNAAEQVGLLKPAEVGSVAINTSPALTDALMKAQANLNKCQEILKQGRVKDCHVSEGKVTGALKAIDMANQTAATVSGELVDKTNAHNEKLLERFDKPMFKVVGKVVGGDTNDGMIVAVAVMITIFELQHILAVFAYGNALRRMNADKLAKPPVATVKPEPTLQAGSASLLHKTGETIATEMAKAQQAREQVYHSAADKLDNLQVRESSGFKQSPEQLAKAMELAGMTYRTELRQGGQQFRDAPLDRPTPTTPDYLKGSGTATPNKPATSTTPDYLKGSEKGEITHLYPLWIGGVVEGSVKVSESVFSDFVNTHVDSKQLGFNKAKLSEVWQQFGDRAVAEGKLTLNPEYVPGNRKQKYLLA
ncbi:hypothetical protein [uncultured Thiothrix sp.]|uniref:hypothetical protein n=1 Tax=uncultured Thiothrix sp. TaxID=223185 RepID=UPI00262AD8D5|nr:hypothetical protein [uncultured Thiothrix sp.]HRJ94790.1 hypothetical protein [Candidatus Thiothrix moscowensis]